MTDAIMTAEQQKQVVDSLVSKAEMEPSQIHDKDEDSTSSTDEEKEVPKELGMVISALQSTINQNKQDPKKVIVESMQPVEQGSTSQPAEPTATVPEQSVKSTTASEQPVDSEKPIEQTVQPKELAQPADSVTSNEAEELVKLTEKESSKEEQKINKEEHSSEETPGEKEEKPEGEEKLHDILLEDSESDAKNSMDDSHSASSSTTIEGKDMEKVQTFEDIIPPTPGVPPQNMELGLNDDVGDIESHSANLIALDKIDIKEIKANPLSPREQEKADEPILRAIRHLFNNRFMKAKRLFENQAEHDPLSALCLGSMAFLKAIMTTDDSMTKNAIEVLTTAYSIASAQINAATKKNIGNSVYHAMSSYYNYIKVARGSGGLPSSPKPATLKSIKKEGITFIPNGVLRAHVAKAECCLQIAILQLLQENVMGYIKCGMNLRRAYTSYSLVWQEYKRMGQVYNEFIDRDTISGIQFGIGAVHLVLSTLPQKVLRIVSAFGWKADKHLGFALLKLCLEERRIRSPMASLMLLAYYTVLTSLCPQMLSDDYTQPAIETLLDAQQTYPNSAFFLYFAGRTSRLARNLTLSSQSFTYAIEISKNEWAEVEVLHLCNYEIAFNYMMNHDWEEAAKIFDMLYQDRYWSPAILRYLTGACLDMMGNRTEAILAYAEVSQLSGTKSHSATLMEKYVQRKVTNFQDTGYQDMDMSLCALEYLYIFTGFNFMTEEALDKSLTAVDHALNQIVEAEKTEFSIRTKELLPDTPPPQYFDQRGVLLLIKSSLYNVMGRYTDAIIHLNWIIDQKDQILLDKWVVPFAFWEAGVTAWGMNNRTRSRTFWESALKFSKYDFEYRLAMRVNLAMTKAEEIGIPKPEDIDPAKRYLKKESRSSPSDSIQNQQTSTDSVHSSVSDREVEA
ncbi:hypothetical protein G6F46_009403 [Rhizopus delemar]|uniref:Tetratricopeptide repeat protein 39C n=2 Tax=Rhizopus TaxID=4842 RepID=A0A9P6YY73_9FUNG|nr:hypothetical protein G6F55_008637 [Rhizopus delemar]KAG1538872.1 hypothetical protein G6F51_009496 [Rhizopus arrhizus]KAG1492576.1 hypothetical protein G6F54_009211 [Rhizopus delemar]KAG1506732.1 hypothetical protein G6F53_009478 [Rhizopus delemar]KAG1522111.1 hypothetical protein G6F52_006146 [Rhizopus delemar]